MKHTSEIVLRALLKGHKVTLPHPFMGTFAFSEEDEMCMVATRNDEEILLPVEMSMSDFIRACNQMPEEERITIVCNLAIQGATHK